MNEILTQVLAIVVNAAAITLIPLLVGVVVQVLRKYGLQIGAEQQRKLQALAENAALVAEEWAMSRLKRQVPTHGEQKLNKAVEVMLAKVPGLSEAEAVDLVHAALPKIGIGASDFLSKVRDAQQKP